MWRFPLQDHIQNENTDTIILNAKQGQQSINKLYEVPTSKILRQHLNASQTRDPGKIKNVVFGRCALLSPQESMVQSEARTSN